MAIDLMSADFTELRPRILVFGVGGAGGNAVNNMVTSRLEGVEFLVANTDAQALAHSKAQHRLQIGHRVYNRSPERCASVKVIAVKYSHGVACKGEYKKRFAAEMKRLQGAA